MAWPLLFNEFGTPCTKVPLCEGGVSQLTLMTDRQQHYSRIGVRVKQNVRTQNILPQNGQCCLDRQLQYMLQAPLAFDRPCGKGAGGTTNLPMQFYQIDEAQHLFSQFVDSRWRALLILRRYEAFEGMEPHPEAF